MATQRTSTNWSAKYQNEGINAISVQGFKSLAHESRIEILPLTILAGANSSGKSSIMQPLLLMKQTLEASYDPGPLLLNGPNVKFTSFDQFASRLLDERDRQTFSVEMENPEGVRHKTAFTQARGKTLEIQHMIIAENGERCLRLTPSQTADDLERILSMFLPEMKEQWNNPPDGYQLAVARDRCFLLIGFGAKPDSSFRRLSFAIFPNSIFPSRELHRMIHVPGLRGTPARSYVRTASGPPFEGTFERYFATAIADWQRGVKLIVETHSAMLLLRVQTLIAKGELDPNLVKLHWFTRDPVDGMTSINSTDMDGDGAFGDWPEDFGEVELMAESAYLDAVEGQGRD